MLDFFRTIFDKPDDDRTGQTTGENITFIIAIEQIEIGRLSFVDNVWSFKYSDEFIKQKKYHRLVGFPNLEKTYTSDVLWPFFKIRIPGLKQPMIQEIISEEGLNPNNEVQLLKRFGRKSTYNPYILETAG